MKIVYSLIFLSFFLLPSASFGQKNSNTLISLPVSVSDREGRYIPGLKKEDFSVYQDGVKQNITFFATYDEPLNIAILLDTSGSTQGEALDKIKDAAKDFVELLKPNDKCMIATFDSQVNILIPFTSQEDELKKSIDKVSTSDKEGTVLYRAVKQITQTSFNNVEGRKVIVLLSDGKDYNSDVKFKELMSILEESDVLIYSIFYQTGAGAPKLEVDKSGVVKEKEKQTKPKKVKEPKKPKTYYSITIPPQSDLITNDEIAQGQKLTDFGGIFSLQEMSETTAGRFYQSDTPNLRQVFKKISAELREQYRIGFNSKLAGNAASSDIIVKVGKPDAVVRTREKFKGN
ncbi:MAG: VWA domain-containing protein [Acidobacteriota bacterium]